MEAVGVTTNESETLRGWRGLAIQYLLGKKPYGGKGWWVCVSLVFDGGEVP